VTSSPEDGSSSNSKRDSSPRKSVSGSPEKKPVIEPAAVEPNQHEDLRAIINRKKGAGAADGSFNDMDHEDISDDELEVSIKDEHLEEQVEEKHDENEEVADDDKKDDDNADQFEVKKEEQEEGDGGAPAAVAGTSSAPDSGVQDDTSSAAVQVLYVGDLFNKVLKEDVESLLDVYGNITEIEMKGTFALVHIECEKSVAEEVIKMLDWSNWMENQIRVKFQEPRKKKSQFTSFTIPKHDKYGHCDRVFRGRNPSTGSTGSQEEREPRAKYTKITGGKTRTPSGGEIPADDDDNNEEGEGGGAGDGDDRKLLFKVDNTPAAAVPGCSGDGGDGGGFKPEVGHSGGRQKIKQRTIRIHCATSNKNYMKDMVEIFGRFGKVKTNVWDGPYIKFQLESSEKQALRCVTEANKIRYKGEIVRAKFAENSYEDSHAFKERHEEYFKNYPKELIPTVQVNVGNDAGGDGGVGAGMGGGSAAPAGGSSEGELPIGVLPPSSSLGAFAAVPDTEELSSIMAKVQAITNLPVVTGQPSAAATTSAAAAAAAANIPLDANAMPPLHLPPPPLGQPPTAVYNAAASSSATSAVSSVHQQPSDPAYLSNAEGSITSVSNKIVLIQFFTGSVWRLAKLIPGQMFVNGRSCLGYALKSNSYHTWPKPIKDFLYQGAKVKMDVKLMSEAERREIKELCSDDVMYATPLVWKVGVSKPNESVMVISRHRQNRIVMKGVVSILYPKWGVMSTSKGDVFFEIQTFFVDNAFLGKSQTLLKYLEKGDMLAVDCTHVPEYLEMSEIARSADGFTGRTDNLKYHARIVWRLSVEIDPHSFKAEDCSVSECQFLNSSSTLFKALPSEREAQMRSCPGTVEEVHLPAGGLVCLDPTMGFNDDHRLVYFHRSRLYINGMKLQSSADIEREVVPGDKVTVDLVPNTDPAAAASGVISMASQYVSSRAHWIATSVHLNATERGLSIARSLKLEGFDLTDKNVGIGRIVHFFPPKDPKEEGTGVSSGIVVIDTGEYAGQRIEFDSSQCQAFGYSLEKADLSQVLNQDDRVYIEVKPYNSYCLERLWVGSKDKVGDLDERGQQEFKKYLFEHGLDRTAFESLCLRGDFPQRTFIPLPGQIYKGKVKKLTSEEELSGDGSVNLVTIEADIGQLFLIEALRENVYVHGHWMGKADLRYVFENEEVLFEFHPVFEKWGRETSDLQRASLVWLGGEKSRPTYMGQGSRPNITPDMDSALWEFVKSKGMDQKMFRALVEGRLGPKPQASAGLDVGGNAAVRAVGPDGAAISLDQETLQQAALLKQMKESFGSGACLQAMMMLMANSNKSTNDASGKSDDFKRALETMMKGQAKAEQQQQQQPSSSTMEQAVAGPSGGLTFPAISDHNRSSSGASSTTTSNDKKVSFKWK